jgi:hypothetical protein
VSMCVCLCEELAIFHPEVNFPLVFNTFDLRVVRRKGEKGDHR